MTTQTSPSVLIIARPGHDRGSLAAVFQTLGEAEMFLLDGEVSEDALGTLLCGASRRTPNLVVVDLDGLDDESGPGLLAWLARRWPGVPRLALSDNLARSPGPRRLNAHCALARSASAGDLLIAARRMSST